MNALTTSGRCCSDLRLDRYIVGELDDDDSADLEAHLAVAAPCRDRLAVLRADRAAFVAGLPTTTTTTTATTTTTTTATTTKQPAWRRFAVAGPAVLAAAASVFLLVGRREPVEDLAPVADVVRAKGAAPRLIVQAAHGGVVRVVGSGDAVVAGELLQFAVKSAGGHAGVVSVDGAGSVSAYAPIAGPLLHVGREEQPFMNAIQLDAVTGHERLLLFVCEAPTTIDALVTAVKADRTAVPAGCAVDVVVLEKTVAAR